MVGFTVELAGVPIRIKCRYEENKNFLHDYFSENIPLFTVEPVQADLEWMQAEFDRMNAKDGLPAQTYSEVFLENNAIHALIAEKIVEHNVLLMHGSALCMDGEAYIFTAPSGTGKSTHTKLWREVFGERVWMINDDKPLLRIEGPGEVSVWGTPWDGKHHLSRNAGAPLKSIVQLFRDQTNHIEAMSKADAFTVLMKQAFVSKNPSTMKSILKLEKQLLDTVKFYNMGCNMEPEAALTAWNGM